jgi:hypothetical protein
VRAPCEYRGVTDARRFAIRYGAFGPLLVVIGLGPAASHVDLTEDTLVVTMGWGFRATVSRFAVQGARLSQGPVTGIGIHGWRGRWLVNGATSGLVTVDFAPTQQARMMGRKVKLDSLRVSLEEPERFLEALGAAH